jgi:hypothetical protein
MSTTVETATDIRPFHIEFSEEEIALADQGAG